MKKLIISIGTYDWIPFCVGMILQEDTHDFEVLRIFEDKVNSIFWCRNLCDASIFEQRRFDLYKIGRAIKAKKVSSLNYNETTFNDTHIKNLITKLQLYIMFNVVSEIYIPNNLLFINIFNELVKNNTNSKIYIYGNDCETEEIKKIILTQDIYLEKLELRKLMIGIHKKEDLNLYKPIERFYK